MVTTKDFDDIHIKLLVLFIKLLNDNNLCILYLNFYLILSEIEIEFLVFFLIVK
jgi:hypothetical protein